MERLRAAPWCQTSYWLVVGTHATKPGLRLSQHGQLLVFVRRPSRYARRESACLCACLIALHARSEEASERSHHSSRGSVEGDRNATFRTCRSYGAPMEWVHANTMERKHPGP
jgi:hypothetical protein